MFRGRRGRDSMVWQLDLQLHVQSVPIATEVASWKPSHGEVCTIHYASFSLTCGRSAFLRFPRSMKLIATILLQYCFPHYVLVMVSERFSAISWNKLHSNEMMMMLALSQTNTLSWILQCQLTETTVYQQTCCSTLDTSGFTANQYLFFLINAAVLIEKLHI